MNIRAAWARCPGLAVQFNGIVGKQLCHESGNSPRWMHEKRELRDHAAEDVGLTKPTS